MLLSVLTEDEENGKAGRLFKKEDRPRLLPFGNRVAGAASVVSNSELPAVKQRAFVFIKGNAFIQKAVHPGQHRLAVLLHNVLRYIAEQAKNKQIKPYHTCRTGQQYRSKNT